MQTYVFDFAWDDQGDSGVWVKHPDHADEICVEAMVRKISDEDDEDDDESYGEPTGEYRLAADVRLQPGDVVVTHKNVRLTGREARDYLADLICIDREAKQIAVNPEQARLLAAREEA